MLPLAACALVLGACGSSNNGSGGADDEQRGLQFARCMRDHGVDMPDPTSSSKGNFTFHVRTRGRPGAGGQGPAPAKFNGAIQACRKYAPNGGKPPSAAQQQEMRDRALRFAQCMRAHGVDFPDPKSGPGGGVVIGGPGSTFNPSSPSFQRAQKACQPLLPGPGPSTSRGGGGGGGGAQFQVGAGQ